MNYLYFLELIHPTRQREILETIISYYSKDLSENAARVRIYRKLESCDELKGQDFKSIGDLIFNHYV